MIIPAIILVIIFILFLILMTYIVNNLFDRKFMHFKNNVDHNLNLLINHLDQLEQKIENLEKKNL